MDVEIDNSFFGTYKILRCRISINRPEPNWTPGVWGKLLMPSIANMYRWSFPKYDFENTALEKIREYRCNSFPETWVSSGEGGGRW